MELNRVSYYITPQARIADLGCSVGAPWWREAPNSCRIDAYDISTIQPQQNNVYFYKKNVERLYNNKKLYEIYDLVVADHIFEHVNNVNNLAATVSHLTRMDGILHASIPDATFFTDRFYRMLLRGGGHVVRHTKSSFLALMEGAGFELLDIWPWPDDFSWLANMANNLSDFGMNMLHPEEVTFVAEVLRKEMTLEKGYQYGWGFVFKKVRRVVYDDMEEYIHPLLMKILPTGTSHGMGFNVQENGLSAMAAIVENASHNLVMHFDGHELVTFFDGNCLLTACIEPSLLTEGTHFVSIVDPTHEYESNRLEFVVI